MDQNNTEQPAGQPVAPVGQSVAPVAPPTQPVVPAQPTQPTAVPASAGMPQPADASASAGVSNPAMAGQPVSPVGQPVAPAPLNQVGANPMPEIPTPVAPVFQPAGAGAGAGVGTGVGGVGTLSATEAIMQPEPAKEPDPEEEELKAPFKAAGPVPGSIGSAVSMPADASSGQTPSVAFNDPATAPDQNPQAQGAPGAMKKKMDKRTLTIVSILGGMTIVALIVILVMVSSSPGQ